MIVTQTCYMCYVGYLGIIFWGQVVCIVCK